jgi:O-antigen/teichoic acid export membrane protein
MLLLALSAVVLDWQLTGTVGVLGMVVALALVVSFQYTVFIRQSPPQLWQVRPASKMIDWLRVSVFLWMAVLFAMLEREISILTVGVLLPPQEVGLFTAAARISQIVDFPLVAANAVAMPLFAALYSQKEHGQLQKLVFNVVRLSLLVALIIALAVVIAAPFILGLLGTSFLAAERETIILAIKGLIVTAMGPALQLLTTTTQQKAGMAIAGCSAIITAILTAIGTLLWGVTGAALASLTAAVIAGIIQNIVVARRLELFPAIVFQLWRRI